MTNGEHVTSKPLILIVDDDNFIRITLKDAFDQAGFFTVTAPDGETALTRFADLYPDLVVLDLIMAGMDGFTACQEIRKLPHGMHTPILMLTGSESTDSIRHAFEAGATDYMAKPAIPELLIYRIHYMLRTSEVTRGLVDSEERLARAQQISRLGSWEWQPLTGLFWGSNELFRILDVDRFSSFGEFVAAVHPADRETVQQIVNKAVTDGADFSFECQINRPDGTLQLASIHGKTVAMVSDRHSRVIGTLQDITEMRFAEDRLKMLKQAIDCLPIGMTLSDVNGTIIYSNPAEAKIHGYDVEELIGMTVGTFADAKRRRPVSAETLKDFEAWKRESVNINKTGEEFPVLLNSVAVKNDADRYLGVVTTCEDLTEKKETEERLYKFAFLDHLTGIPNRTLFLDRLRLAMARARREQSKICLAFLDLDNFKDVNDTLGHDFGDKLLKKVSERLAARVRSSDTLARLGGDEFVMIIHMTDGQLQLNAVGQRILSHFSQPFEIEGKQIYTSASVGIALFPEDGMDEDTLIKCADTAMYHAKGEGKAGFRFFSEEMNLKIMRRVALENGLRLGLEKEEYFLEYQPQWDLKTGRITGVEALVRWQSPEFGLLPPSGFIALIEDSNLIFKVGEWIFRTACLQARAWADAGHHDLKVAINISGKQLKQPSFLEDTAKILLETAVRPESIELEFTESVIMSHADKTIETLQALKKMGFTLSIDDFGTGYSSLSYLKHLPIDRIKIDRSFVAEIHLHDDVAAIVHAILSLANSLKLNVIAEGIETDGQMHKLAELGCFAVQGFLLAMPMSAADVSRLLIKDSRSFLVCPAAGIYCIPENSGT